MTSQPKVFVFLALLVAATPAAAQVGALDPDFAADGLRIADFGERDFAFDVVVAGQGTIFVVGNSQTNGSSPNTRDARLVRYAANGSETGSWAYDQTACGNSVPQQFLSAEMEPDGHLIAGGYTQTLCSGSTRDFWLLRIDQDGGEVDRFDQPALGTTDFAYDLELQPDGLIVAAGFSSTSSSAATQDLAVVRYLGDGSLDASGFGTNGMTEIDIDGESDRLAAVKRQPDGRLVAVGFSTDSTLRDLVLIRLNADGSPDATFGTGGQVVVDFFGYDDEGGDLLVLPDGSIVVVGYRTLGDGITAEFIVARFTANGALDSGFGSGGVVGVDFDGPAAWGKQILQQPDGKLVVAGTAETGPDGELSRDFAVARILLDGTLDPSWDGDGRNTADLAGGLRDEVLGIAIQPDGDIVVVGYTQRTEGNDTEDMAIARFKGDSSSAFFSDGFESGSTGSWSAVVNGL